MLNYAMIIQRHFLENDIDYLALYNLHALFVGNIMIFYYNILFMTGGVGSRKAASVHSDSQSDIRAPR